MKKKKNKVLQLAECIGFYMAVAIARTLPIGFLYSACRGLGNLLFKILPRRGEIAVRNIGAAFGDQLSDREIKSLARRSCQSLFLTGAEMMRSPFRFKGGLVVRDQRYRTEHLEELFRKAKRIHDESGGCIFLTPHLGNWELLPYVSALIGIPLAIVMRPLDNPYLEQAITSSRIASGQIMIPKRNAMFALERMLRKGKSIGMLPDQSTGRGLLVDFFGRKATATPIPALLAVSYDRPVVVVAACRTDNPYYFEGFVSDPITPDKRQPNGEQAEIVRITEQINRKMEEVIRRYPEQYLWMHNRWKEPGRKAIFARV